MERKLFKLRAKQASVIPPLHSRRMRMNGEHSSSRACYKSGGKDDEDDDEDEDTPKEQRVLLRRIRKIVESTFKERGVNDDTIENLSSQLSFLKGGKDKDGKEFGEFPIEALRAMADENTGVMKKIIDMGVQLQELQGKADKSSKDDMSIRSQCERFLEENKEIIQRRFKGENVSIPEFEIQFRAVSSPMLPANVMPNGTDFITKYSVDPNLIWDLRPEPTFWDFLKKGSTDSETYIWMNKVPTEGSASFIGPGEYKPAISFQVKTQKSHAKKIAVNMKMATELLQDISGFSTWVEQELRYAVMIKLSDTLRGAGVATDELPAGIQSLSTPYDTATGVYTQNPNIWDAIKAGVTMLRLKRFRGKIVAILNPADLATAVMTKAQNQGQLFIPPVTGAIIVEDLEAEKGSIQFIAVDYWKILIYKAFTMKWGWENDDFTKNLVTTIGEMRLHEFHSENHDGFAVYDTIKNITDALIAPVEAAPEE